ncbi:hypothetical protein Tco_1260431, partial [Tanacetum coccineum]
MQTTHGALMPHDLPIPRVHSLGSDEGSLTLNELTVLSYHESEEVRKDYQDKRSKKGRFEHDFKKPNFSTAKPDISTANVPVSIAGAKVSTAIPEV